MALILPISPEHNNIDKVVDIFATRVINTLFQAFGLAKKFAGLLGISILSILLLFFIPFFYLYMRRVNSVVRRKLKPIYNWINEANESDLRYAHLEIERKNKVFHKMISRKKIFDRNVITMGISSQTNLLISQFLNLEDSLKNAAYPNFDQPLSASDVEELLSIFEGAEVN